MGKERSTGEKMWSRGTTRPQRHKFLLLLYNSAGHFHNHNRSCIGQAYFDLLLCNDLPRHLEKPRGICRFDKD